MKVIGICGSPREGNCELLLRTALDAAKKAGAETELRRALELNPGNGAYMDSLGWALYKKGMYKESLAEMEKAIKQEPDDPTIRQHLGEVRKKLKTR